jgi:hypothetical protein
MHQGKTLAVTGRRVSRRYTTQKNLIHSEACSVYKDAYLGRQDAIIFGSTGWPLE